jgi:hypothetical protein
MGRKPVKGGEYRPGVAVKREAKDRLAQWCEENDEEMSKTLTRLILWFVDAKPLVQAVARRVPLPMVAHAYAAALRQMADDLERVNPPVPAAAPRQAHPITVKTKPLAKPGTGSKPQSSEPVKPEEK